MKQEKPRDKKSPAKRQVIRRLEPKADFLFASELTDFIKSMNQAKRRGIIPRPCADLFALMGDEAERLADDAREVEADGCYFIFHLHPENADSDPAESSMPVLASRPGTAHLTSIASAVESLMAWVSQRAADASGHRAPTHRSRGKPKRSMGKGEARDKLISALTKHHDYANEGCLNQEPIKNNEIARMADVAKSTASEFFTRAFGSHKIYSQSCRDRDSIIAALKLLNQEFTPRQILDSRSL